MQYVTLNNDLQMPALGFGVFRCPTPPNTNKPSLKHSRPATG